MNTFLTTMYYVALTGGGTGGGKKWSINTFLQNLGSSMQQWGKFIVFVIGGAMVIGAAYFIAKGLMSQGRSQTNWALTILLLIIGGAFMAGSFGGWSLLQSISEGSKDTIEDLGGVILPMLRL